MRLRWKECLTALIEAAEGTGEVMKTCVYTVLLGGYDQLLPQPVANESGADFICFTDDPELRSDDWTIQLVEPRFPQDLHRSSRVYKILGHEVLEKYDATLCIDASVRLRQTPEAILEAWLTDGHDMALVQHSYREQVVDEFDEVIRLQYDDRARVYEQLVDYSVEYPEVLSAKPHWGGMLARRTTPEVARAMRLWFDHVLRYSRRDQLSLMLALMHGGLNFRSIELDNFGSEYHEWPVITGRKIALGKAPALPSGPLLAELRRCARRVAELETELAHLGGRSAEEMVSVEAELRKQLDDAGLERAQLIARLDALRQVIDQHNAEQHPFLAVQRGLRRAERAILRRLGDIRRAVGGRG